MEPQEELKKVSYAVMQCVKCELHLSRKRAAPGEGPANAEIMFIGERPGFHENEQGRPFVGAAGRFLDELLASIDLKRADVFITNIVKCRPPGNRDPQPGEIGACHEYLERQIQAINPKLIVTLGRYSMANFMPDMRISAAHGQAHRVKNRMVVAMYHPAAALHQQALRIVIEQDFLKLPDYIRQARCALQSSTPEAGDDQAASGEKPSPKQLSLF